MTTITIERELLERAAALLNPDRSPSALFHQRRDCAEAVRAALAAPATAPERPNPYDACESFKAYQLSCRREAVLQKEIERLLAAPATAPATTSIEDHTLERLLDAWDTTVLPKHRDGAMQEWMEALRHEFTTCPDRSITGRVTDMNSGLDPDTETDDRHAQELLAMEITLQNMRERHAQEICAYELTVQNLRDQIASAPAWHDAPTVPGLWVVNWRLVEVRERELWAGQEGRWYGPIPEDKQS